MSVFNIIHALIYMKLLIINQHCTYYYIVCIQPEFFQTFDYNVYIVSRNQLCK